MSNSEKVNRIRHLIYHFAKNKNIDIKKEDRISGHNMMLLYTIKNINKGDPVQMTTLAKHFKISAPAISQISRRLEKLEYIKRIEHEEDRRSVYISLTPKALKHFECAENEINANLTGLVEYLGDQDSEELIRILEKVDNYFDKRRGDNKC